MVKMSDRQKRVAKRKRDRKKKWAPRKQVSIGFFIGSTLCLSIFFIITMAPGIDLEIYNTTGGGELDLQLMGVGIKNPYNDNEQVVVFSDDNGKAYIDSSRSNWVSDGTETIWNVFDNMDESTALKPPYLTDGDLVDDALGKVNDAWGWIYAPPEKYSDWNRENTWLSATGCNIDPDARNTGVPDLGISISNIYPSDSLGKVNDDYGHTNTTRTLVDSKGNTRTIEIHYGFVTLQVLFSITGNSEWEENNNNIQGYVGEQVGVVEGVRQLTDRDWNTLGGMLKFNAVFRLQINALAFTEDWILNPTWLNLGNGILEVWRRGFGDISYTDEVESSTTVAGIEDWIGEDTDIQKIQQQTVLKFAEKEDAMDLDLHLTPDDGTVLDFKTQNPNTVFLSISNFASLGIRHDNWFSMAQLDTLEVQELFWVQNIVVKFYTSVAMPLAGEGQDPIKVLIVKNPPPAPSTNIWDRIVNWVAKWLGVKQTTARLIIIAVIIIAILVSIAIFAPQVYAWIGKAIASGFRRWAEKRATRKTGAK